MGLMFSWIIGADVSAAEPPALPRTQAEVVQRLRVADRKLMPQGRLPWSSNDEGRIGWTTAYAIRAMVRVAVVTKDRVWLDRAVDLCQQAWALTDPLRYVTDYRGQMRWGWSARNLSDNRQPIVWFVESGHMADAMTDTASELDRWPKASEADRRMANQLREWAALLLEAFEPQWRKGVGGETGTYVFGVDEPHKAHRGRRITDGSLRTMREVPLPLNQQLLGGKAMIRLGQQPGGERWKQRALELWSRMQSVLIHDPDGGWTWPYWPKMEAWYPSPEPVHYAGIDLSFVRLLRETEWQVVSDAQWAGAVATTRRVLDEQSMAIIIDGKQRQRFKVVTPEIGIGLDEWGRWWERDCGRWQNAMRILWKGESPSAWLGWAELLSGEQCF